MSTCFCDGVSNITILHDVVRLEFQRLDAARGQGRELQATPELVMAMPLQGFLAALEALEKARDRFLQEGVIKPTAPRRVDPPPSAAPPPATSPNFP